jgi:hypothetical protein
MLIYLGLTMLVFFSTFILFCAVIKLRDIRDKDMLYDSPWIFRMFAYLTLFIGFFSDTLLNMLLTPILLEFPQELLTTNRMIRLKRDGNDWQKSVAKWLCSQLARIDVNHCKD